MLTVNLGVTSAEEIESKKQVNINKICSRIDLIEKELKTEFPNFYYDYESKIDEYYNIIINSTLLDVPRFGKQKNSISKKERKELFKQSHRNWKKYKELEIKMIDQFYNGDGSMFPYIISRKSAKVLKARAEDLLGYIGYYCINS